MMQQLSRKVVMVGTSLDSPGGMTSVVRVYRDFGFFDKWNVAYLSAYERPGLGTQLRVMTYAVATFLGLVLAGKVGLLHVHSASRGSFWRKSIFCAIARAFRVPYIFHLHSGEFPVFARDECGPLARRWIRHTLHCASRVVALTSSWRAALEDLAPGAKVVVLGNPVVMQKAMRPRQNKASHVLFLGRLREKKGVFDLVRAIPQVLEMLPDARFTLAGDGDLDGVAKQAAILGVRDAVTLPGWVDGGDKDALPASADVLVLPSYFEGLPICVLEAMAIGVPVVSTAIGGIPEVLEDGACGILVNPGDVDALASSLVYTLSNQEAVGRSCDRAFMRALNVYSAPAILAQLAELYTHATQRIEHT
jgi:glycosyltransferase involved in cell wall biosynthesis